MTLKGFAIGIGIGLASVAIVIGVGLIAQYFCDRGHGTQLIVGIIVAIVFGSGIYGANVL